MALFLEYLYRWNKQFGPRHLVVEEVQQFSPQGGKAESKEMLQVLSTMGRMEGIGLSIVTQRPAIVDKTVIANTDAFVFYQLMLPQDLGAVTEVLTAKTNLPPEEEAKIDAMIAAMPCLGKGEVILYSPEWLQVAEHAKVDGKRFTQHTGATPDNFVRPLGDEPGLAGGAAAFQDGAAQSSLASEAATPAAADQSVAPVPATQDVAVGEPLPRAPIPLSAMQSSHPASPRWKVAAYTATGLLAFPILYGGARALQRSVLARRGESAPAVAH